MTPDQLLLNDHDNNWRQEKYKVRERSHKTAISKSGLDQSIALSFKLLSLQFLINLLVAISAMLVAKELLQCFNGLFEGIFQIIPWIKFSYRTPDAGSLLTGVQVYICRELELCDTRASVDQQRVLAWLASSSGFRESALFRWWSEECQGPGLEIFTAFSRAAPQLLTQASFRFRTPL